MIVKVDEARFLLLLLLRASGAVLLIVVVNIEDRILLSPSGGSLRSVRWGSGERGRGSEELVELGALEGRTGRGGRGAEDGWARSGGGERTRRK